MVYIDKEVFISNPTEFPEVTDTSNKVKEIQEPVVKASIIAPEGDSIPYFGSLTDMFRRVFWEHDGAVFLSQS